MNQIVYERRCRCKEEFSIIKKPKPFTLSEGRAVKYPYEEDEGSSSFEDMAKKFLPMPSKTFQIKYEKKLSPTARLVLSSFRHKYLYYAIDDILYLLKSNPIERDNILAILYSPVLSLHNNLSINFFDIWIDDIYINEISKVNKFLTNDFQNFEQFSYITLTLFYRTRLPVKKPEPLW